MSKAEYEAKIEKLQTAAEDALRGLRKEEMTNAVSALKAANREIIHGNLERIRQAGGEDFLAYVEKANAVFAPLEVFLEELRELGSVLLKRKV